MCRWLLVAVVGCASFAPTQLRADNWFSYHTWRTHWGYNVRWPEQHLEYDRTAARAPSQIMIANGWRAQNTISNYHFEEETGELNDTGKLKVRAILFETPVEWRTVHVLRADREATTTVRMQSVQKYIESELQGESSPPILITNVEPRGTRGDIAIGVSQRFMENAPAPVLPAAQRDTGM